MLSENTNTMVIIIFVATLTQVATDIYTPSIPAIASHFESTLGYVQLTMSFFLAGLAIFNLIYGPLSEGIGRRLTLVIGILIALCGTLLCIYADSINLLLVGRFIQGAGLAACTALWRSIFRDLYDTKAMAKISGYLVAGITVSLILSPLIGGFIQQYIGWRANFIVLLVWMLIVLLVLVLLFKESSLHHGAHRLNLRFLVGSYVEILSNRSFVTFSLMSFLCYGALLSWLTAGPVILIRGVGIPPSIFGILMIITGITTGVSGIIGGKITHKFQLISIVMMGLGLIVFAGVFLIIAYYMIGLNLIAIMVSALLFIIGSTFVFMNCFALGFKDVGHIAGYAGSLYACIQMLGGVCFTAVLGNLSTYSPVPMGLMFIGCGILSFLVYKLIFPKEIRCQ